MKGLRWIGVVLVLVVLGVVAWRLLPAFRTGAADAVRRHAGWTEAARRKDPVGFMDYAERTLNEHLEKLVAARGALGTAGGRIDMEKQRTADLMASADRLAGNFKAAFVKAEPAAYPVTVAGASYGRDELIEQVRLVLLQRRHYKAAIADLETAAAAAEKAGRDLLKQVTDTRAALAALPAKREIARVNELTGST